MSIDALVPIAGFRIFSRWLLALIGGSIVPLLLVFDICLSRWSDVDSQWAWLTIAPLPVLGLISVWVPRKWLKPIVRLVCVAAAAHAGAMIVAVYLWDWRPIATTALPVDLVMMMATARSAFGARPSGRLAKAILIWVGCLFGIGLPLAVANAVVVMSRAETIAGDAPYCIQYASQTDAYAYEPASTLFDLSGLKMQARIMAGGSTDYYSQNHALLVVDRGTREFLNWSYGVENFVNEAVDRTRDRGPDIYCIPKPHYASQLPIWSPEKNRTFDVVIGDRKFSIPQEFRPRTEANALIINAVYPEFGPYQANIRQLPQFYSKVFVTTDADIDLAVHYRNRLKGAQIESHDQEFGLDKTIFSFGNTKLYLYSGMDAAGHMVRLIYCSEILRNDPVPRCSMEFVTGGLVFRLRIAHPPDWPIIETKLAQTLISFEGGARPPG